MPVRPRVNDPIVLRDDAERAYRSRVEEIGPDLLTVARPLDVPTGAAHGPGDEMLVTWNTDRGMAILPTRLVAEHIEGGVQLWSMAVTGDGWVEQRRRFVRVPATGQVTLQPAGGSGETVNGHLVDVSEGGLRCSLAAATADLIAPGDLRVTASFRFGDREFAIAGRLGSRTTSHRGSRQVEIVVVFDEPGKHADALRKEIFAYQVRALRLKPGSR